MLSGTATTIIYYAFIEATNAPKTGDAANHTIRLIRDGAEVTPAGTPAEVDATNAKGIYKIALTGAENTGNFMCICGVSSTSGVAILPTTYTTEASSPSFGAVTMTSLNITNSSGDAVTFHSTFSGGNGLVCTGTGSGAGMVVTAGSSGTALSIAATSGPGIDIESDGAQFAAVVGGLQLNGNIANIGLQINSAPSSHASAVQINGGHATGFPALAIISAGPGVTIDGDNDFDGVVITAQGAGNAMSLVAAGSGEPLHFTVPEATSIPAASDTFMNKFGYITTLARNKVTQTTSAQTLFADDNTTTIGTAAVSSAAGTVTLGKWS